MTRDLEHAAREIDWGTIITSLLAVILAALGWSVFHSYQTGQIRAAPALVLLVIIQSMLYFLLERSYLALRLSPSWHYRLVYTSTSFLGVGYLILEAFTHPPINISKILIWLIAVLGGVFLGALLLTWQREGLAENNSPPSERIQQAVLNLHQQRIGQGDPIEPWKRTFDILVAVTGILISAPFWLVSVFLIWIENPGPILFVKNSVTRGGNNFRQYKFRTMVRSAEAGTGPVLAKQQDERVLHFGALLRKTALDELPQLLNILRGEMSFVGPRPQRTVLVAEYLETMPEYAERHRVLPGLAGLAQVAGDYYLSPRQKLRFDRLYIQHASLGFDLKLLGLAFLITFWYRWRPGWNGRLPRLFLHQQRRSADQL